MALRVSKTDPYVTLREKAVEKWKAYCSNLYHEKQEYVLLLEDGKEAVFLPGSCKEFFSLQRYQEELGKDFKRITLYLCSETDFKLSEDLCEPDVTEACEEAEQEKKRRRMNSDEKDENKDPVAGEEPERKHDSHEIQIEYDSQIAQALQDNLNDEISSQEISLKESAAIVTVEDNLCDHTSVVQALQDRVIDSGQFFMVMRRGSSLERIFSLWNRERLRNSPEKVVRVKFIGEDGIDTGALAKEFFANAVCEIGTTLFPEGSPIDSTHYVQNGNFRVAGEIVAASLAQGGPPPCFLEDCVFDTLVNSDVDIRNLNPGQHMTASERRLIDNIREDVSQHQDVIIEHGYTGKIDAAHIDDIVGSIMVSIWNKRVLYLKEFKEGLSLYGLSSISSKNPQACKALFTKGQLKEVDANYLFALVHPEYSPQGSSRRQFEEKVIDNFQDFLLSLEDEQITGYSAPIAWREGEGEEISDEPPVEHFQTADLSPAGVMGWLTGQRHRAIDGHQIKITAKFDHDCKIRNPNHRICFPFVGACGMEVTFPTQHMSNFTEFRDIFLLAYCKGQAFGKP